MTDLAAELYRPHIEAAAKHTAKRVYHLDTTDLTQELWAWFYSEGRDALERSLTRNPDLTPGAIIRKAANRIAQKELTDYRTFQGNFCYQPSDIRRVLTHLAEEQTTEAEARLDVEGALEILEDKAPAYRQAIIDQYFHGEKLNSTKRAAVSRGVDLITHIVNENTSVRRQRVDIESLTDETDLI